MIELLECIEQDKWDEYVLQNEGHPLQLWGWGEVKSLHGWSVVRLFALENDSVVGAVQVLIRQLPSPFRSFAYIPRGSVFHVKYSSAVYEAIAQYVRSKYHSVVLSVEPDSLTFSTIPKWIKSTNKILPPETILLDITQDEVTLLASMAKKTRQYIRKSAQDVEIRKVKSENELKFCLDIYKDTARRAGFSLHDDQYYLDVFKQMGEFSPIFIAISRETPVAFLWLAISEETAYELYGGMSELGQILRANYALKWHAIQTMKEWGIRKYDFGGLVAGGVSTFKQGWSKGSTVFAGTYDRPLSPLYVLWSKGLPLAKRVVRKIRRR